MGYPQKTKIICIAKDSEFPIDHSASVSNRKSKIIENALGQQSHHHPTQQNNKKSYE